MGTVCMDGPDVGELWSYFSLERKKGQNILAFSEASATSLRPIVRRFLGDLHVVHVALAHAGGGDLHEFGALAQVLDRGAAAVAHGRANAAAELVDDRHQRALV